MRERKKSWPDKEILINDIEMSYTDSRETSCKHGKENCEKCGTTHSRDVIHTTKNGIGRIGHIFRKK